MRTEIKKEQVEKYIKQLVEVEREVYVADDGKKFKTERECINYEKNLLKEREIKAAEKLKIPDSDEFIPLSTDGLVNGDNTFRWYKARSEEEFNILNAAYEEALTKPDNYPEIICVETVGHIPYMNDAYDYHTSRMMEDTKNFWEKLGYKVTFEKEREI